jgi:2-keto-4-pentenoate hydratase/2-oxohepta-3-ene-1,7-dioic acid hydratase in catechol pathway
MEITLDEVGKLVALGHTVESHSDAPVQWPMIRIEPPETLIADGEPVVLPPEVEDAGIGPELTAVLGDELHRGTPEGASWAIDSFTVSIDVSASGDRPGSPAARS